MAEPSKTFDLRSSINTNIRVDQTNNVIPNTGRMANPNNEFPAGSLETDSFKRIYDFINNYGEKTDALKKKRKESTIGQIHAVRPASQTGFRPEKRFEASKPETKATIKINACKIQNKRSKSSCSNSIHISGVLADTVCKVYGGKSTQKSNLTVIFSSSK